ncbi:MAG: phosphate transport system regulatory protein PhoU [Chloroflexi bacterium HGW-Chloroflexi-10]|nr:MAG: phosphate transport system regulatory protein PhoU [Chloroflexi bacterium HGW-Chloroflexi-10]
MSRPIFDRKIKNIQDEVLLLGSMVEEAVNKAILSLKTRDYTLAQKIYKEDIALNEKRYAIENAIIVTIATQQPNARDLRLLTSMFDVSAELERMGDYAKGIAKVAKKLHNVDIKIPIQELETMAELSVNMLHKALTAFIEGDPQTASQIPYEDDAVDQLYENIYHQSVELMMADPQNVDHANLIMWVGHNLERMADRVTNICERTVFIATGDLMELEIDDEEDESEFE